MNVALNPPYYIQLAHANIYCGAGGVTANSRVVILSGFLCANIENYYTVISSIALMKILF